MGSNDSVPKAQFIERVDESLFSELKDGNVNVMRLFYRIFGHLPKKTYMRSSLVFEKNLSAKQITFSSIERGNMSRCGIGNC